MMTSGTMPARRSRKRSPQEICRLQLAADQDVGDEQAGQQQSGKHAREPELADRLARDHPVEDEHDARRDHDAERAAGLDDARHHDLVVVALEQLRQRHARADGHAGHRQAVHGRDRNHQ